MAVGEIADLPNNTITLNSRRKTRTVTFPDKTLSMIVHNYKCFYFENDHLGQREKTKINKNYNKD